MASSDPADMPARTRFTNIGFSAITMKQEGQPKLKSDIGVNLTKGATYYLHKPIAHRLRFGIEAVWADITYSNYKVTYVDLDNPEYNDKTNMHGLEISMQVGPAVNFNVHRNSELHGYFRYAPSFSGFYNGDEFEAGFANFFVGGASISWKCIGVGVEARFGSAKYKSYFSSSDEGDFLEGLSKPGKIKTNFSGCRAYVTFRF